MDLTKLDAVALEAAEAGLVTEMDVLKAEGLKLDMASTCWPSTCPGTARRAAPVCLRSRKWPIG